MKFLVLFEDNHLFAVSKPAGLATQSSEHHQVSLETLCKEYLKKKHNKPGNVFLHAIHRLDKPTSGVVLFAKSSKANERLQEAMRKQELHKKYLCLVEGIVSPDSATLEHLLSHDDHFAKVASDGKRSVLHYTVIKKMNNRSLVEVVLETGRNHQIRAQFSAIGHPVLGDKKYGSKQPFYEDFIALHHLELKLSHPVTHEELVFTAPLPSYWEY
jgi:23S rRNA pseudouridine1911/1915/1917 synthase